MKLREVMTRRVESVGPETTLEDAARRMEQLDVGALPVCEGGRVIGMVTDRDIVIRAVASGRDPIQTRVREVHSGEAVVAHEDQDVDEVARLMQEHQIRRIPVVRDGRKLVGIVSLGDLAVKAEDNERAGQVLEDVSKTPPRSGGSLSRRESFESSNGESLNAEKRGMTMHNRYGMGDDREGFFGQQGRGDYRHEGQGRDQGRFGYEGRDQGRFGYEGRDQGRFGYEGRDQGRYGYEGRDQGRFGYEGRDQGRFGYEGREQGRLGYEGRDQGRFGYEGRDQGRFGYEGQDRFGYEGQGRFGYEGRDQGRFGYEGREQGRFGSEFGQERGFGGQDYGRMSQGSQGWGQGSQGWGQGSQGWGGQQGFGQQGLYGQGNQGWGQGQIHQGRGPKGYKRSDDRIREDVCDRLTDHPEIDASDIEVKVQSGEVTLTGTVPERRLKHMVEHLVESMPGVQEVHNQLRTKREDTSRSHTGQSTQMTGQTSTVNLADKNGTIETSRNQEGRRAST